MVDTVKTKFIKVRRNLNKIITNAENEIAKVVEKKVEAKTKAPSKKLTEAQKAENKKKRAEKTEKRKAELGVAISDKKGKALAATLLFKQGVLPAALEKLKAQKKSASEAAAIRYKNLTIAQKDAKRERAAENAVARKEAKANETAEQKAKRLEKETKRKEKLDKGLFAGMFPV